MKFMKLGSKPDLFQTEVDNTRYVATDLATDIIISIGDVKFYLHKFPLLSKSFLLQKLVASSSCDDEINIDDIPGGPAVFEICAKFCYGMAVTLNAYNVVAARCAAEYLEMLETVEKGNLIYKIDIFLASSIFRSWKDSIILLQTTKSFRSWLEELKVVSHCVDSIATRASTDPSRVSWSYTCNCKKLQSENRNEQPWNGARKQVIVPKDWWVEDLCDLPIDLYKRVITAIKAKGKLSGDVIGEALRAYAVIRLPGFGKGTVQEDNPVKYCCIVDTLIHLLPTEKGSVPCSFLLKLLLASMTLKCGEMGQRVLMHRIAWQLDEADAADLLIRSPTGEVTRYNIDVVHDLVKLFVMRECNTWMDCLDDHNVQEMQGFDLDASKAKVARLVESYLSEAARDPSVPLSKFIALAEIVSSFPRLSHDGIYRAIDMYLQEHPALTKSEKKRICRLMDCRRLSAAACAHAVENDRLPSRVVVQVLFFEQARASAAASGSNTSDQPTLLPRGSCRSSQSATTANSDEHWDGNRTWDELKDLKGELTSLRQINTESTNDAKLGTPRTVKRILSRLWLNSSSNMSRSPGSVKEADVQNLARRMVRNGMQKQMLLTK